MGNFGNEFGKELGIAIGVFIFFGAIAFGYFYNKLMDKLKEGEHTSLYVMIGVAITLAFVALFSWKAALLTIIVFALTGTPMIVGDFKRTLRKSKASRRKPMPYVANGLIDDIRMKVNDMIISIGKYIETNDAKHLHIVQNLLAQIVAALGELKMIQDGSFKRDRSK